MNTDLFNKTIQSEIYAKILIANEKIKLFIKKTFN